MESVSFSRHRLRKVHSLNFHWEFAFLGDVDWDVVDLSSIETRDRMPVPMAFDALPDYAGCRGVALYRTQLKLNHSSCLRLHFEAVSIGCRVYVDGLLVGECDCGYTPFWCDVPYSDSVCRTIEVLVDNRIDYERFPLHEHFFDFYQWGGLIRGVWAHEVDGFYFKHVHVRTESVSQGQVIVGVAYGGPMPKRIGVAIDEGDVAYYPFDTDGSFRLTIPNHKPWSPNDPHLHNLRIEAEGDDFGVRFGLREVETKDQQILLNGEPLKLLGFNRHESHPQFGPALPTAQLMADLQLLRKMGCNFVRGSHYPQDQRFLDLCDELGFLVWEEGLGWGQREKQLVDPKFRESHQRMLTAMVDASYNHPSVIMWGFLNEVASNEAYAKPIFEESVALLRKLDPSRPITYASMFPLDDHYYDLVDVISHNLYPGWYGCEDVEDPLELILPHIRRCLEHIDSVGQSDKPYILSEIGVEALYGWHDAHNGFFTEEYQANYLEIVCREVLENPRITGCAIWHFSDARTYSGGRALLRPRAFNNKGVLDEYRRPKSSFRVIENLWNQDV